MKENYIVEVLRWQPIEVWAEDERDAEERSIRIPGVIQVRRNSARRQVSADNESWWSRRKGWKQ
jgi:hypothetical protein